MANPPPLSAAMNRRSHPRFLGRYELVGELARGGMGTVFLARHAGEAGFQRLFAIKILHAHLAEEKAFVDMLRDEGRIAARIHHPNVVAVVDLGTHGDSHYVVMEYVEGPSFATLVKRSKEESAVDLILSVVIDTLEGLHAAHTLKDDDGELINLVHRDVSPQNILVGVDGVARITDFGIAKAESRIASTLPGTRKGKLRFMSPEQMTSPEEIDQRTDIWAIGVVLWSVLTGEHLFKGDNDASTLHNVLSKEIPPPSSVGKNPPACLDSIILRALERDPSRRFASALEMADALRTTAASAGLITSRHRVAQWVSDTFKEELDRRREAIREVAHRRSEFLAEQSQVTSLPLIPSMTGQQGPLSPEYTGSTTEVSGSAGLVGLSADGPQSHFSFRQRRSWVPLAVAAGGAFTLVAIATTLLDGKPSAPPRSEEKSEPIAAATRPAEDTPALAEVGSSTSPSESAKADPSGEAADPERTKEDGEDEDPDKASAKSRRAVVRWRPPRRPAVAPVSTPAAPKPVTPETKTPGSEASTAPTPTAGGAVKPAREPAPREFESNPYLRR